MLNYLKVVWAIVRKDLVLEWRDKSFALSIILLSALLLLISSMALEGVRFEKKGSGFLWVILLAFSSISGFQLLNKEKINGTWRGLLLIPVDRSAIFFGKWISHLVLLFMVEGLITPFYFLLFGFELSSIPLFLFTIVLGTTGFSLVTTFISSLTLKSSNGMILLPVLQLPLLIPLFLAVISLTDSAVYGTTEFPMSWIGMLLLYNLLFLFIPWILFPILTEVDK
jgi:heme exporter protein B